MTYTGQQFDGITGQYYLRARFYNPVIGRFAQDL
ncbi:RHS repeat-associated core domain-containing protein [Clostridium beijerinckii]|nr:RHS repeat-associated core domain-containing protein [Clostridium beijerinckii]